MPLCKKVSFSSELKANEAIGRINNHEPKNDFKGKLETYLCDCGYWHLTSRSTNGANTIKLLEKKIKYLEELIDFEKNLNTQLHKRIEQLTQNKL